MEKPERAPCYKASHLIRRAAKNAQVDQRVAVVRADSIVGRGTCSPIDEAFSDAELIELFEEEDAKDPKAALRVARSHHRLWKEQEDEILATIW